MWIFCTKKNVFFVWGDAEVVSFWSADHDPHIFKKPYAFDINRNDTDEMLSFNGKLSDIYQNNYEKGI